MVVAAIAAGTAAAGLAGSAMSSSAASHAGDQQLAASKTASNILNQYYQQGAQYLQPYINNGTQSLGMLQQQLPGLTAQFQPTMAQLSQTPGYQFTLGQGLKATQNSLAAKGLGQSGEALAGAGNYAEGLAGTTYQQQFQNYLAQNQQIFNMLSNQTGQGLQAANSLSSLGVQAGGGQASAAIGGAAASGAGQIASANALGQGLQSLGNIPANYMTNQIMQQYYNNNNASGGGSGGPWQDASSSDPVLQ